MSVELSLYPYKKKWPKKPTVFRAKEKDEVEFRNFYEFYAELSEKLPREEVPNTVAVWIESIEVFLTDSGMSYQGEGEKIFYWKSGQVGPILRKHMRLWKKRIDTSKEKDEEDKNYYREYMKKLKKISVMKPSTPLVIWYH